MPDLSFQVESVEPVAHAVAPLLAFRLRITQTDGATPIHTIALRCQIRIEPTRRRYVPAEEEKLHDLFGEPARWGSTLRSMLWAHTTSVVTGFTGTTLADLPVPCTFDFNVAATKYFHALEDGFVPLLLLFSGSIFFEAEDGHLQVVQIPWEKETNFRLPVPVWKDLMERYYPNCAWLCLRRDVFDRLSHYKSRCGLPTWEQAFEELLKHSAHETKLSEIQGGAP
jgi:hypothetical protein